MAKDCLFVVYEDSDHNLALAREGDAVFRAVEVPGSFYSHKVAEFDEREDIDPKLLLRNVRMEFDESRKMAKLMPDSFYVRRRGEPRTGTK